MNTILHYVKNSENALLEISQQKGQVTVMMTPQVWVVTLPESVNPALLEFSTDTIPDDLDELSKRCVIAWNEYQPSQTPAISWGTKGFSQPQNAGNNELLAAISKSMKAGTHDFLLGTVTVGLNIISGPTEDLKFTEAETTNTIGQTAHGLNELASKELSAEICFKFVTKSIEINELPRPGKCGNYEECEKVWRDPALAKLGVAAGHAGVDEYNLKLVNSNKTRWAFSAFFIKYPAYHFAYAIGGMICMQYENNNWGSDKIDRVFAHETAHIFGAADEYTKSKCDCSGSGIYKTPNYNCKNCKPAEPKVECLMDHNTLESICHWTRAQLGWYGLITNEWNSGRWSYYYDNAIPFTSMEEKYIFAHSMSGKIWFISKLNADGSEINRELAFGTLNLPDLKIFSFTLGTKTYLYSHSLSSFKWYISELTPDGEGIGKYIKSGAWSTAYPTMFPYYIGDKVYIFKQSETKEWFISELASKANGIGSRLNRFIRIGRWDRFYKTAFSFQLENKSYMFGQFTQGENGYFISELTADAGLINDELVAGNWSYFYDRAFPFVQNGKTFMFAHSQKSNIWFVSELSLKEKVFNQELAFGALDRYYNTAVPFSVDGKTRMFRQSSDGNRWMI